MPITRELQDIADDLAVFESALIIMRDQLPPKAPRMIPTEMPAIRRPAYTPSIRKPELPRCVERRGRYPDEQCREPQSRPKGLCVLHFARFAHNYGANYSWPHGQSGHGQYTCRLCGRQWRYVTCSGDPGLISEVRAETHAAIREVCPSKMQAWSDYMPPKLKSPATPIQR